MSSTFPHFSTSVLSTSFSASYVQQSNLESLIERHLDQPQQSTSGRRRSSTGSVNKDAPPQEQRALLRRQPTTIGERDEEDGDEIAVIDEDEDDMGGPKVTVSNGVGGNTIDITDSRTAGAGAGGSSTDKNGNAHHHRHKSSGAQSHQSFSKRNHRPSMSDAEKRNLLISIHGGGGLTTTTTTDRDRPNSPLLGNESSPLLNPSSPNLNRADSGNSNQSHGSNQSQSHSRSNSGNSNHNNHNPSSRSRSRTRAFQLTSGLTPGFSSNAISAAAQTIGGGEIPKIEAERLSGYNGHGQLYHDDPQHNQNHHGNGDDDGYDDDEGFDRQERERMAWQDQQPMLLDPAEELDPVMDLGLPVDGEGEVLVYDWRASTKSEFSILFKTASPILFTQIAEYSLVLSSVISLGHLGTTELAASSLASMTASVTAFSILQGMASALDTLLPAAWTSNDPTRVGLWTQRMILVMSVCLIPMYFVWWNAGGILLLLRQDPEVAALAESYLRWLSMGIPGYALNQVLRKYFQSQNLMTAPTTVIAIVAPLNAVLTWLLVWGPAPVRLGFIGAPIATATSFNAAAIVGLLYASFVAPKTAWGGFSREAFSKLGTVTSLGLAGTIMISSEWWAWEFVSIAASQLGPTVLAVNSILLSFSSIMFQVPQSLGIAVAVRVGNLLGAARPYEAKIASRLALVITSITSVGSSLVLIIFRHQLVYLFNSDAPVVEMVPKVAIYVAAFQLADGIVGTMGGVLRAIGKQSAGALFNLTAYYVIGLPLGIYLCFSKHLDLAGLWIGLSVALYYCSFATLFIVLRTDWHKAVDKTRMRLGLGPATGKGEEDVVVNYGTMGGH